MTRPNNQVVPLSMIDQIVNILSIEYDNPQLVVSILVKLSRKFAEKNVFTQLKSVIVLHTVMQSLVEPEAQTAWSTAIESMCEERDEKMNCNFFALSLIEETGSCANTAMELETTELARQYIPYVFDIIALRQPVVKGGRKVIDSDRIVVERVKKLLTVLQQNEDIQTFGSHEQQLLEHELHRQCMEKLAVDYVWLVEELKKVYVSNILQEEVQLEGAVEAWLLKANPSFTLAKRPMIEAIPPLTTNAATTTNNNKNKKEEVQAPKQVEEEVKRSPTKPVAVNKSNKNLPTGLQQSILKGLDKTLYPATSNTTKTTSKTNTNKTSSAAKNTKSNNNSHSNSNSGAKKSNKKKDT